MPPPPQPNEFSHLPSADGGAADARRTKEALWKQAGQQRRQTRIGGGTLLPPELAPSPASPPEADTPAPQAPAHLDAHSGWGDLFDLNPDDAHVPVEPLTPVARTQMVATPTESGTRGDMHSRKRTIIRRSPQPPLEVVDESPYREDPSIVTRVVLAAPPAAAPEEAPLIEDKYEPDDGDEPYQEREDETPAADLASAPDAEVSVAEAKEPEPSGKTEKQPDHSIVESTDKTALATEKEKDREKDEDKAANTEPAKEKDPPSPSSDTGSATTSAIAQSALWLVIRAKWVKWGGQSLGLSLGIHAVVLLVAAFIVVNRAMEPQVDFLPGGGTVQGREAAADLQHKVQQKKNPWLRRAVPMRKLAAANSLSDIVLPEEMPDILDLPKSSPLMDGGGKLGGGLGLGGSGGGFGKGVGLGGRDGMVFQPLSMFGREIKAKRLALILDVSASMAPHMPRVIEELDKVAKNSVVVLYYGCGIRPPPPGGLDGDELYRTSSVEFEKYWRMNGATLADAKGFKFKPTDPIPMEDVFRMLSKRPQTYFVHQLGGSGSTDYTWVALLSEQVRQADALYWFADFQDYVEFKQLTTVYENLNRRKQKLYIHAYMRGSSFDLIRTQLVERTNGDVIEESLE